MIAVPEMQAGEGEEAGDFEARMAAIDEWIGLVLLASPRVEVDDAIEIAEKTDI